jgi:HK97 family phage major capsid protein
MRTALRDDDPDTLLEDIEALTRRVATEEVERRVPYRGPIPGVPSLGLDTKDAERFSWARAMTAAKIGFESRSLPAALGYEAEVVRAATQKYETTEAYADLVQKLASNTTGSSGAFMVPSEVSEIFVEKILAQTIVGRLGARRITVRSGQLLVNGEDALVTTNFLDTEDDVGILAESSPAFKQLQLRPRWVGSIARATWEMQRFSEPGIEELIQSEMQRQIAVVVDQKFFTGSGSGAENRGIINAPGLVGRTVDYDSVKYGVTTKENFTDKTRDLAQLLLDDNFDINDVRFAAEPTVHKAIGRVRDSQNRPLHLPTDEAMAARLIGLPVYFTSHLKSSDTTSLRLIAGVWNLGAILADWGPVAIAFSDSASGAFAKGQKWVRAIAGFDCAVIRPTAFAQAVNLSAAEITND